MVIDRRQAREESGLNLAVGEVVSSLHGRCRAIEFKKFLITLDREAPADLDAGQRLHPQTPAIKRWLAAHPRFVLRFTPTSGF
ncbi:hypothetical protein OG559_22705 [Micromonospora sp. NBC_01405]|uniref:hypothetical protein n=1 Tax=Micromonospora sp. NBC_01405 TaxID=2903589 RepID=UPI00325665AE